MELTEEQKKAIAGWVAQQADVAEIQRKLASEFKLAMTYMDVRFLLDDLGIKLKDTKKPDLRGKDLKTLAAEPALAEDDSEPEVDDIEPDAGPAGGNVKVDVDLVTKAGAVVSGTVKFSDGVSGKWMLDNAGRLALSADKPAYRPSPGDVQQFQKALGRELQKRGF